MANGDSQDESPKKGDRMDLKEIGKILEMMKANGLSEFEIEDDGFRLAAKRGPGDAGVPVYVTAPVAAASPVPAAPAPAAAAPAAPTPAEIGLADIASPMVGTFYRAASPESEPLVSIGQEVEAGTVVCIIEAMKVMNEIKAEKRGVIRKIGVENGASVQFGEILFKIGPAD